ncbi:MAG: hypothetical protein ACREVM_10685, partial [Burkholderiales bacterium]
MKHLLAGALCRLSGSGGDPVVQLQTNFGGGKTHSILALYHLFSATPLADLTGLEPVLQEAGINQAPKVRRRLFEPLVEQTQYIGRDTTAKTFFDLYRT